MNQAMQLLREIHARRNAFDASTRRIDLSLPQGRVILDFRRLNHPRPEIAIRSRAVADRYRAWEIDATLYPSEGRFSLRRRVITRDPQPKLLREYDFGSGQLLDGPSFPALGWTLRQLRQRLAHGTTIAIETAAAP